MKETERKDRETDRAKLIRQTKFIHCKSQKCFKLFYKDKR